MVASKPMLKIAALATIAVGVSTCLLEGRAELGEEPDWLLVGGRTRTYASRPLKSLGEAYLGQFSWKLVEWKDAEKYPSAHRLLVGTPADNAAVKKYARALGILADDGALEHRGFTIGPAVGLVLVTDDPDGEGLMALITGGDQAGVEACFSVRIDLGAKGFTVARWQDLVHRELGEGSAKPSGAGVDRSRPQVIRLDRDFDYLRASLPEAAPDEVALRLARGQEGYAFVYQAAFGGVTQLLPLMREVVAKMDEPLAEARERFAERDVTAELLSLYDLCAEALGPHDGPSPTYYVMYGHPTGTNAKNFDDDPQTGRRRVLINLCRMPDQTAFEVAVIHETVHTFQRNFGPRLVDRAVVEGVATYLTQELRPETSDELALMWTRNEFEAARRLQGKIVAEVRHRALSTDQQELASFLQADRPLDSVRGAPSRTAYYVGWLAAAAWREQNPGAPLRDLLTIDPMQVLDALD